VSFFDNSMLCRHSAGRSFAGPSNWIKPNDLSTIGTPNSATEPRNGADCTRIYDRMSYLFKGSTRNVTYQGQSIIIKLNSVTSTVVVLTSCMVPCSCWTGNAVRVECPTFNQANHQFEHGFLDDSPFDECKVTQSGTDILRSCNQSNGCPRRCCVE
jgi:hypothetical protein